MQVVTNENLVQLIQTGKVDDFKPPEAPAVAVKEGEQARDDGGKFVKPDAPLDTSTEKADKADTAAESEAGKSKEVAGTTEEEDPKSENYGDDLPEKARKKIGNKHRLMKEAEEFAEREFDRRKAAERRAAELEEENLKLKAKSGPAQEGNDKSQDLKEPVPEDFKTVAEYARAVIKYEKALDARASVEQEQKSSVEKERERLGAAFKKQEAEVIAAHPDYRETVNRFDPSDLPGHIAQYLIESGPLLTYQLAKLSVIERNRITQLSPIRAIAELGKLEAKLEKPAAKQESSTEQPAVSKAPSPIKPLSGDGAVPVNKDPATMSFQELREYERQREAERRARR